VSGLSASAQAWPLRSDLELAALPTAVPCARLHAKNILNEWRIAALADTAELLVSEILTNAVRASASLAGQHTRMGLAAGVPVVRLWLSSDRHRVLIQVRDGDPHHPASQHTGLDAETGRGLLLVDTLSDQWGCYTPTASTARSSGPYARTASVTRPTIPANNHRGKPVAGTRKNRSFADRPLRRRFSCSPPSFLALSPSLLIVAS
jgi:anti-sigma regulatory factor (Ser/Thr protein kinase)